MERDATGLVVVNMACRTGCPTKDHDTWGACARDAAIQIDRFSLQGNNEVMEKRKNHSLERYRQMRKSGLEPLSPLKKDLDAAEKAAA